MTWFYYIVVAGFGLIFGSFFNVCIYRIPLGESLGHRSHCPSCDAMIRWHDNIPLLSFIILKGKCRRCGSRISIRYPLVELVTSLLFVLMYWWSLVVVPSELGVTGGTVFVPELLIGLLMVSVLIITAGADIGHGIVPNKVMYPGLVAMLLLVTALALYRSQPGRIGIAVAAGVVASGFLFGVGLLYGYVFMRKSGGKSPGEDNEYEDDSAEQDLPMGIGMGDIKLVLFFGMALGYFHWYLVLVGLFLGYLIGAVGSIFLILIAGKGRKDKLVFAPFLSAGAILAMVWGQNLVDLYLKLSR